MDRMVGVIVVVDFAVEFLSKPGAEPPPVPADWQASAMTMASACSTASKELTFLANSSNAAPTFASGANEGEKWFVNSFANERTVADVMSGIEGLEEST